MKKVTGSFICLFTVLISVAQPLPQKVTELNNYCNFLKNAGFSGQMLVAEKGKIISNQNFGYANKEAMYPVATTTVFNIASFTKQFTATAVLWYDSKRGLLIVFGGDAGNVYGDTWSWDGKEWKRLADTGPQARSMGYLACDKGRDRVIMFGGRYKWPNDVGDTWEWDGTKWDEVKF